MRDPFASYDAWLEAPYQRMYAEEDRLECPECGVTMDEDKRERSVECPGCGFADGYNWDAEAERRADRMEDA
ncbi:hypothetical protein BH24ACT15_BH24ACT15_29920 [soil metagenome]